MGAPRREDKGLSLKEKLQLAIAEVDTEVEEGMEGQRSSSSRGAGQGQGQGSTSSLTMANLLSSLQWNGICLFEKAAELLLAERERAEKSSLEVSNLRNVVQEQARSVSELEKTLDERSYRAVSRERELIEENSKLKKQIEALVELNKPPKQQHQHVQVSSHLLRPPPPELQRRPVPPMERKVTSTITMSQSLPKTTSSAVVTYSKSGQNSVLLRHLRSESPPQLSPAITPRPLIQNHTRHSPDEFDFDEAPLQNSRLPQVRSIAPYVSSPPKSHLDSERTLSQDLSGSTPVTSKLQRDQVPENKSLFSRNVGIRQKSNDTSLRFLHRNGPSPNTPGDLTSPLPSEGDAERLHRFFSSSDKFMGIGKRQIVTKLAQKQKNGMVSSAVVSHQETSPKDPLALSPPRKVNRNKLKKSAATTENNISLTISERENCMTTVVPYYINETEDRMSEMLRLQQEAEEAEERFGKNVEVPAWRVKRFQPILDPSGVSDLEDISEAAFLKRHQRLEIDERRRKRWDSQRVREETYLERLKRRMQERERQKTKRRRAAGRKIGGNPGGESDDEVESVHPNLEDVLYVRVAEDIPISTFGHPMPILPKSIFDLPWTPEERPPTPPPPVASVPEVPVTAPCESPGHASSSSSVSSLLSLPPPTGVPHLRKLTSPESSSSASLPLLITPCSLETRELSTEPEPMETDCDDDDKTISPIRPSSAANTSLTNSFHSVGGTSNESNKTVAVQSFSTANNTITVNSTPVIPGLDWRTGVKR